MLSITFKKTLRDFSIDLEEEIHAETLVLIGNSGCGKTTTLHMLAGLLSPDKGEMKLDDEVVYDQKKNIFLNPEDRNIGYVFQNYALFPHLSVQKNMDYGIRHLPAQDREDRVREVAAFLKIDHLLQVKPNQLSGGEQQRVALGRALVIKPKLLLLDEPLSALDVSIRSHVRAELKNILKNLGIPVILVTHDYDDARILADRVAVMAKGKIIQSGTPEEIRKFPCGRFVAKFTDTNLVSIHQGAVHAAFDPWKVVISSEPVALGHEWQGKIEDIVFQGGYVRVRIAGEASIIADIPMGKWEENPLSWGDAVYAFVKKEDVRLVTVDDTESGKEERLHYSVPFREKNWKKRILLVPLLFIVFALSMFTIKGIYSLASEQETELLALVASNASAPFEELIEVFEERHPEVSVEASYAGTQMLRSQLEGGVNADLFLGANEGHMKDLQNQSLITSFSTVSYNRLVLIVPQKGRTKEIESLADLSRDRVRLVIGTEAVPIGQYTREVFERAEMEHGNSFTEETVANVVSLETNVKRILQKVAMGEAEAGIVYATDVTPAFEEEVKVIEIPRAFQVTAANFASVPVNAAHPELAEDFIMLLLSEEGQHIFKKYNYESVLQKS